MITPKGAHVAPFSVGGFMKYWNRFKDACAVMRGTHTTFPVGLFGSAIFMGTMVGTLMVARGVTQDGP